MGTFYNHLRSLASNCGFTDNDKEIKSQVIQSCVSSKVRQKALQDKLTLEQLLDHARADELSKTQTTEIEKVDNINTMTKRNKTS